MVLGRDSLYLNSLGESPRISLIWVMCTQGSKGHWIVDKASQLKPWGLLRILCLSWSEDLNEGIVTTMEREMNRSLWYSVFHAKVGK